MTVRAPTPEVEITEHCTDSRCDDNKTLTVLLVDDNSADNLYHRLILEEEIEDVVVVELPSGPAAISYLVDAVKEGSTPHLLLLDLNMPGMTGWDFLNFVTGGLMESCPDLQVVVLSTTENPDDIERACAYTNVESFMAKPLDARRVRRLLDGLPGARCRLSRDSHRDQKDRGGDPALREESPQDRK